MKASDFKNKVGNKRPSEKELINDFEKTTKNISGKLIPFCMKHGLLLVVLCVSILLYFIYSIFAHTKEVTVVFLIVGFIYGVRFAYLRYKGKSIIQKKITRLNRTF